MLKVWGNKDAEEELGKKSKGNKDAENLLRVRREKKSRGNNFPSLFFLYAEKLL